MALQTLPTFPGLSWPMTRRNLGFGVDRQESIGGGRTRLATRSIPRWQWELNFEFLRADGQVAGNPYGSPSQLPFSDGTLFGDGTGFTAQIFDEIQRFQGFWNQTYGGALPFLYTEPSDQLCSGQMIGVGDGVTTTFQCTRTLGGFTEPVFAPVASAMSVVIGGAPDFGMMFPAPMGMAPVAGSTTLSLGTPPTTAYTLGNSGAIIFNTAPPPGAPIYWSGSYQWVCRFDDDQLEAKNFMDRLWSADKLTFSSEIYF